MHHFVILAGRLNYKLSASVSTRNAVVPVSAFDQ